MTFIPLKNINFVRTKVEYKPEIQYTSGSIFCKNFNDLDIDSAGIKGTIKDKNDDSYCIILDNITISKDSESLITVPSNTTDAAEFREGIASLLSEESFNSSIFDELDSLREDFLPGIDTSTDVRTNYNSNNFKNTFSINKLKPKFLYDDYFLRKKNIIKNNLYSYYLHNKDVDNLNNINWGFYNYNTINFFNNKKYENITHSNCIVYPNLKINDSSVENTIDAVNKKDFCISFYINKRKESALKNKGCIFHIPGLVNCYIDNGTSKNISQDINGFKLRFTFGKDTYKHIDSVINNNSSNVATSDDNFIYSNFWNSIAINFFVDGNVVSLNIYQNGEYYKTIKVSNIEFDTNNSAYDSYICIGNKPSYIYNNNGPDIRSNYFKHFFAQDLLETDDIKGPYFKKHISFGSKTNLYNNSSNISQVSASISGFTSNLNNFGSEALESEICDFRIYKKDQSSDNIRNIFKRSVENVSLESDLDFYLPVYFVPIVVQKEDIFNASGVNRHIQYSGLSNPYFANTCGGYKVSIESFLVDFVNQISPNVVINNNSIDCKSNTSVSSTINYSSSNSNISLKDYQLIKKGSSVNEVYLNNLCTDTRNSNDNAFNLHYINNLILPNDNGLQLQKHKVITNSFNLSEDQKKFFEINDLDNITKDFHINTDVKNIDSYNLHLNFLNNDNEVNINNTSDIINFNDVNNEVRFINTYVDVLKNKDLLTYHIEYSDSELNTNGFVNDEYYQGKILSNFLYHSDYELDNHNVQHRDFKSVITSDQELILDRKSIRIGTKSNINSVTDSYQFYDSFIVPYYDYNKYFYSSSNIIEVSSQFYNKKIEKETFNIKDVDLMGSFGELSISLKDNGYGCLYRSDCKSEVAKWNYVGHLFYSEGIATIHHPGLENFGSSNFNTTFRYENNIFVNEINIQCESGMINESVNKSYNSDLKSSESSFDSDESFVYITDINLHDENLNIVAKAKLAQPVAKKNTDNILFRLKMDY